MYKVALPNNRWKRGFKTIESANKYAQSIFTRTGNVVAVQTYTPAFKLRTRDEIAAWMVSIYQDAIAFKYTHDILLAKFQRVRESRDWKHLTQQDRSYIEGYARCYDVMVIQRSCTESGSWVTMPDGAIVYFGVRERLGMSTGALNGMYPQLAEYGIHRYIHEHEIQERSGIYWVDGKDWNGKYPFFIPALHSKTGAQ